MFSYGIGTMAPLKGSVSDDNASNQSIISDAAGTDGMPVVLHPCCGWQLQTRYELLYTCPANIELRNSRVSAKITVTAGCGRCCAGLRSDSQLGGCK